MTKKKMLPICECCKQPYTGKSKQAIYCKNCGKYISKIKAAHHTRISNLKYIIRKLEKKLGLK